MADVTSPEIRGAGVWVAANARYGRALLGPLVAIALMAAFAGNVRVVFWIAVIPALAAVMMLAFGVEEPPQHAAKRSRAKLPSWHDARELGRAFWMVVAIGTLFTLARFSEAFLVIRANEAGLSWTWTPLALAVMNVTYVVSAYPVGRLSDRIGALS